MAWSIRPRRCPWPRRCISRACSAQHYLSTSTWNTEPSAAAIALNNQIKACASLDQLHSTATQLGANASPVHIITALQQWNALANGSDSCGTLGGAARLPPAWLETLLFQWAQGVALPGCTLQPGILASFLTVCAHMEAQAMPHGAAAVQATIELLCQLPASAWAPKPAALALWAVATMRYDVARHVHQLLNSAQAALSASGQDVAVLDICTLGWAVPTLAPAAPAAAEHAMRAVAQRFIDARAHGAWDWRSNLQSCSAVLWGAASLRVMPFQLYAALLADTGSALHGMPYSDVVALGAALNAAHPEHWTASATPPPGIKQAEQAVATWADAALARLSQEWLHKATLEHDADALLDHEQQLCAALDWTPLPPYAGPAAPATAAADVPQSSLTRTAQTLMYIAHVLPARRSHLQAIVSKLLQQLAGAADPGIAECIAALRAATAVGMEPQDAGIPQLGSALAALLLHVPASSRHSTMLHISAARAAAHMGLRCPELARVTAARIAHDAHTLSLRECALALDGVTGSGYVAAECMRACLLQFNAQWEAAAARESAMYTGHWRAAARAVASWTAIAATAPGATQALARTGNDQLRITRADQHATASAPTSPSTLPVPAMAPAATRKALASWRCIAARQWLAELRGAMARVAKGTAVGSNVTARIRPFRKPALRAWSSAHAGAWDLSEEQFSTWEVPVAGVQARARWAVLPLHDTRTHVLDAQALDTLRTTQSSARAWQAECTPGNVPAPSSDGVFISQLAALGSTTHGLDVFALDDTAAAQAVRAWAAEPGESSAGPSPLLRLDWDSASDSQKAYIAQCILPGPCCLHVRLEASGRVQYVPLPVYLADPEQAAQVALGISDPTAARAAVVLADRDTAARAALLQAAGWHVTLVPAFLPASASQRMLQAAHDAASAACSAKPSGSSARSANVSCI